MTEIRTEHYGIASKWMLLCCALSIVSGAHAQLPGTVPDEPVLTFLATDPVGESKLGREEPFYVRFEVKSSQAVGVMPDAYYHGEPVVYGFGTGGITLLPAGGGTAVTKLFFWGDNHTPIDEVRLYVGSPKNPLSGKAFSLPVKLIWTGQPSPPRPLAAWVQESLPGNNSQHPIGTPKTTGNTFTLGIIALVLTGAGLVLWGLRTRRQRPPTA
jgi:hypothetical protein